MLARINPEQKKSAVTAAASALGGPALIYAGIRFPGTKTAKAVLVGLGVFFTVSWFLANDKGDAAQNAEDGDDEREAETTPALLESGEEP